MSGKFVLKQITKYTELTTETSLPTSDYCIEGPESIIQFDYVQDKEEAKLKEIEARPGVFFLNKTMFGYDLVRTEFTEQRILPTLTTTKQIVDGIDTFFNNIALYEEEGMFPKRASLLFGPAGSGKSSSTVEICKKYGTDGKTFVLVWNTDQVDPADMKSCLKSLSMVDGAERMILIAEDLMGVEMAERDYGSPSSLLSILDNKEKIYKVPVFIIATTNNPENFQQNIIDRPERFDDKIEVGYPDANGRVDLLKFFSRTDVIDEAIETYLRSSACNGMTPAHIRESRIRARLRSISLLDSLKTVSGDIKLAKNRMIERTSMGML